MLLQDSHLTFGEIADRWARESADHPGSLDRDQILDRLERALRYGEFGFAALTVDLASREVLVDSSPGGPPNYVRVGPSRLVVDQYTLDKTLFRNPDELNKELWLEGLRISKKDFGQWCDEQGLKRPKLWFDDDDKVVVESTDKKVVGKAIDAQAERKSQTQDVAVEERMPRQIGRPSLRPKIEAAYQDLKDAGGINFDEPKAALCKPIREKVHQSLKGDASYKGLRDGAILKWIRPLFDDDKTAHDAQSKTTS